MHNHFFCCDYYFLLFCVLFFIRRHFSCVRLSVCLIHPPETKQKNCVPNFYQYYSSFNSNGRKKNKCSQIECYIDFGLFCRMVLCLCLFVVVSIVQSGAIKRVALSSILVCMHHQTNWTRGLKHRFVSHRTVSKRYRHDTYAVYICVFCVWVCLCPAYNGHIIHILTYINDGISVFHTGSRWLRNSKLRMKNEMVLALYGVQWLREIKFFREC